MRRGVSPTDAAKEAVSEIGQYYPNYKGAIVAVNVSGSYGESVKQTVNMLRICVLL